MITCVNIHTHHPFIIKYSLRTSCNVCNQQQFITSLDGDFAPIKIILGRLWSMEEVKRGKRNKKHEKKFQKRGI